MMDRVIVYRHQNDGLNDVYSIESGLKCDDESLAVQSAKEETDINEIVRRFGLTGEIPGDFAMPQFVDVTEIPPDYKACLDFVKESDSAFMTLPADVRARFENNPQGLFDFLADSKNRDEAIKLGLIAKPVEVPREPVPSGGASST